MVVLSRSVSASAGALDGACAAASGDELDRMLARAAVLVVDDEPGMCNFLKRALQPRCALVEVAASAEEAEALRLRYHFDMLLVDIRLPGLSGLDWLAMLRERGVCTPVIYMTAYADLDMSIQALRHGAGDFVIKPFRTEAILQALRRWLSRQRPPRESTLGRLKLEHTATESGLVGRTGVLHETLRLAQRVAPASSTVLLQGESGTGKRLLARTVHRFSRRSGAFVALDCSTVPREQLDTELFGHVRTAFAGTPGLREGLFGQADRGTLFLDEIADLPLDVQARLVRLLEQRPSGRERDPDIDVRLIASTRHDLGARVRESRFREDLWYRLTVFPIRVPPLRERIEDLPLLIDHFNARFSAEFDREPVTLMHADHERMRSWCWPGNVRELRDTLERAVLLGRLAADSCTAPVADESSRGERRGVEGYPLDWPLEEVERWHMRAVLDSTGNNKSAAARVLGVSRKTLERKQQVWSRADARSPLNDDG